MISTSSDTHPETVLFHLLLSFFYGVCIRLIAKSLRFYFDLHLDHDLCGDLIPEHVTQLYCFFVTLWILVRLSMDYLIFCTREKKL